MYRFFLYFVFSLFLVGALVLVASPAIAIVVVSVSGEYTPDDTTSTGTNERAISIKLTYSHPPDRDLTESDIETTTGTDESVSFNDGQDDDPKTYYILWQNLDSATEPRFTLFGYQEVVASGELNTDSEPIVTFSSGVSLGRLLHDSSYLAGLGYAIIAKNNTAIAAGVFPTLPRIRAPNQIFKVQWTDVSNEQEMPDLNEIFQGGGSLNLRVNEPGTTNRLGSKTDDETYDDDHERNGRQVVINEVMWGHDNGFLGNPEKLVQEQWIELYNRTTTPIAFADMEFTTSKEFPGPEPETDLLSNVPNYEITWEMGGLGQHGSSQTPKREFRSMQRINYDNGWESGHWNIASTTFLPNYKGTPGRVNRAASVPSPRKRPGRDTPAKDKIIINEIGNHADDALDWIELRNVTGSDQSLKEWTMTKTIGYGNESEIIRFPEISIPARGILLLVNMKPKETSLSLGLDITVEVDDQEFGAGPHEYLKVESNNLALPNDDRWLLILRSGKPWDVGDNRDVYQTGFKVEDVAGPGALHNDFKVLDFRSGSPRYEKKSDGKPNGDIWDTKVFPLNGNSQKDDDFLQSDRLDTAGKVWVRDDSKHGYLKDAWSQASFTGIGYDRKVRKNDQHGGTPGFSNDVAKEKLSQLDGGRLIVNELMLTSGNRGSPQWIELYNTSKTRAIDLAADSSEPKTGWQLIVENHNSGVWDEERRNLNITVNLKDLFPYGIPPNQSVLIVSAKGRASNRDYFPDSRVAGIFETKKSDFGMTSRRDQFLNAAGGFYISIVDGDGTISDEVGNLDGIAVDLRKGIGFDDPFSWNWSTDLTEKGHRTSLIRLRDQVGRPRIGIPNRSLEGDLTGAVLPIGTKKGRFAKYAWVHAVDTAFKRVRYKEIWYGNDTDISTPGFIRGTPLPVSLSFFRPSLENGEVIIRWTTESELDNAGFNILRSNTRNGVYKQINTKMIQGAGTIGERSTYKWIDSDAKSGTVYYYQIEDVSFTGERKVLTTKRLIGLISAKNKLTTTWSELKNSR